MNRIALMALRNFWKVPWAYMKLCHYAKHTEQYAEEIKYRHCQYILKTGVESGNIRLQVFGEENIPREDGFLMYANHQGLFDIVAIAAACDRPWAAVLKMELRNVPIIRQLAECTKSHYMYRNDVRQSMKVIQAVTKEVGEGRNYLIFPEGTRSRNGNHMLEFRSGSFKCALKSGCPVLPVALVDSYRVLDQRGSKWVTVQLHYLKPILYEEYKGMGTAQLAGLVYTRIEQAIAMNQ